MDKNIFIKIQYDGTRYSGWQRQGNTDNTIETKISTVLSMMLGKNEPIEIHGSGRTDAGVHAMGQVANFHVDTELSPEDIKLYLNKYLPEDIKVISAGEASLRFHSRLNAKKKTYVYKIDNGSKADVFLRKYTWHIKEKLDVSKMRELSTSFMGEHDFASFSDMKAGKKSTVRCIDEISIDCVDDIISIEFTGNGFLYHMVRKLTAAFVEVGLSNKNIDEIIEILNKKDKNSFKELAPAKGLMLKEVFY